MKTILIIVCALLPVAVLAHSEALILPQLGGRYLVSMYNVRHLYQTMRA